MTHATETPNLNPTDRAIAYLRQLAPHARDREAAQIIEQLVEYACMERAARYAAESALRSAGERVRNALRLAKNWIEHDEGRTLEQILAIEARGNERGVSAFNPEFMAACIAIDTAISALPVQGEVKINAAPQEKREDAHRADGDGALPESDSPAGAAPTEPPLAGAKGAGE